MKILFLLSRLITNFVLHLAVLFKKTDSGVHGGRRALSAQSCEKRRKSAIAFMSDGWKLTTGSDDEVNTKSLAIFRTIFISFQLLVLSAPCQASTDWSPLSWVQNIVFGKQYEATQAYKKQDYEESLATFHDLMNQDPYNPEYNYNVGDILYRQKKYKDARQAFTRAVEHARKSSKLAEQAYFNIGNSCYQLELWQDAVLAYQQVLKINEDNESARHNLELALYKLKEQAMKDKQQEKKENKKDKSQDKNQDKSCDKQEKSQDSQSGGDDDDQGDEGNSPQDQGQKKPGSQKNSNDKGSGEQKEKSDGGTERDEKSQEKSAGKDQQQDDGGTGDEESDQQAMNESEKEGSEKSSKNKLQNSGTEKQDADNAMQDFEKTQGMGQEEKSAAQEDTTTGDEKKDMHGFHKKPELKNQLQDQYESKASQDERLTDYHASVMKTLEDLEEKIQKHIIKNKVAMQGAGQNGKNGW